MEVQYESHSFARGARIGVRSISIPLPVATAAKCDPYFASLSRIRNFGATPKGRCLAQLLRDPGISW
jgi:hypothetical protein